MSTIDQDTPGRWTALQSLVADAPIGSTVSVTVRNLQTGEYFSHLGEQRFPAASTIKVLILIAVARAIDTGSLKPTDKLVVRPEARVSGSGVLNWLETGLELSVHDHAWLMIAISDNTASNVLIDAVGLPALREVQASLGLMQTAINRRFLGRWPRPNEPDNEAASADLVKVLVAIARDEAASPQTCGWMRLLLADQQHDEQLGRDLPESVSYAGKTGWLSGICHDCGLLSGPGGIIAVAVLTSGIQDKYEAQAFIGKIGALLASMIDHGPS